MEFIRTEKPEVCVEIGSFGGAISYPIVRTLNFLQHGVLHAIDAWDTEASIEGLKDEKVVSWLKTLDMNATKSRFQDLFKGHLEKYCKIVHQKSSTAVSLFADNSIDLLYIDGNGSREGSLNDVLLYFPKVKEGGYIWLNDADQFNKNLAVAFLMKHCEWVKEKSIGIHWILFKKK
jgi:hypothetical protein